MGQGKHGVKVGRRQQFRPSRLDPPHLGDGLTLRAVPIAAGVVSLPLKAILRVVLKMTAQAGGAAGDQIVDEALLKG